MDTTAQVAKIRRLIQTARQARWPSHTTSLACEAVTELFDELDAGGEIPEQWIDEEEEDEELDALADSFDDDDEEDDEEEEGDDDEEQPPLFPEIPDEDKL